MVRTANLLHLKRGNLTAAETMPDCDESLVNTESIKQILYKGKCFMQCGLYSNKLSW